MYAASPKGLKRGERWRSSYRPRLGFYPLLIDVVARGYLPDTVPAEQFPDTPVRIHEDTRRLQPLIDDGVIDEVIRSLKSGKEATVYLVRSGAHTRCAKVYRDMGQRSFQKRAQYQEGRKVRGSRQARAIAKSTRFGRKEQEAAWKNAEVDALYKLVAAGVRVPKPYGYFNDTLIMELVTDAAGDPAPRLGEVDLSPETAREYHALPHPADRAHAEHRTHPR